MKRFYIVGAILGLVFILNFFSDAQQTTGGVSIPATVFSRTLLTNATLGAWQAALGLGTGPTNGATFAEVTNIFNNLFAGTGAITNANTSQFSVTDRLNVKSDGEFTNVIVYSRLVLSNLASVNSVIVSDDIQPGVLRDSAITETELLTLRSKINNLNGLGTNTTFYNKFTSLAPTNGIGTNGPVSTLDIWSQNVTAALRVGTPGNTNVFSVQTNGNTTISGNMSSVTNTASYHVGHAGGLTNITMFVQNLNGGANIVCDLSLAQMFYVTNVITNINILVTNFIAGRHGLIYLPARSGSAANLTYVWPAATRTNWLNAEPVAITADKVLEISVACWNTTNVTIASRETP